MRRALHLHRIDWKNRRSRALSITASGCATPVQTRAFARLGSAPLGTVRAKEPTMHSPTQPSTAIRSALAALALLAFASAPAAAAVSIWEGDGLTRNFDEAENWNTPPVTGSDLVFPASAYALYG